MNDDEQVDTTTYRPDWQRKPTAEQMARYYPERAQRAEIGGTATIKCKVGAGGRVNSCVPVKEAPEGYDFGKAAVRLSAEFEMTPPPPHLVDKKEITVPITFTVPPSRPFLPPIDMAQLGAGLLILVIVVGGLFGLIRAVQADRRMDL